MKATEFLQTQILDEVSMRPSVLRQEAAKTGALAGIEFEMIVPGAATDDDDEQEPDYNRDERITDFDSIEDFFNDGDINSSRAVKEFIDGLKEGYFEWAMEHRDEQWSDEGREFFDEYVDDWFDENKARKEAEEEVKNEYGDKIDELTSEDLDSLIEGLVEEKKQEWLDEEWDDRGRYYDRAKEAWEEGADWPEEHIYLKGESYRYMSDLPYNDYNVYWPYFTSSSGGDVSIDEVANDFANAIGKPVNASYSYHGARREAGTYVVEPDSSLEADEDRDGGLEFVSPPMPVDEMLSDFQKVIQWAKAKGCYTNQSTGLHMNVSVPNFSRENCDYVKLALLLGDRYILEQFGRVANTYTKSSLNKIIDSIKHNPERAQELFQQIKTNLHHSASKIIHSGITDKYTSINAHQGYIEFRSPGGDWLNDNWAKLESTLLRFVVALDAACDPQKYRQDYLKKLYRLLQPYQPQQPSSGLMDPVAVFAKFSAGQLSKDELQQFIKQLQLERQVQKQPPGTKYWWRVTVVNDPWYSVEVVASNKEEAMERAKTEYPKWSVQNLSAVPLRPYTSSEQNVNEEEVEEAEQGTPEAFKIITTLKNAGYNQIGSGQDATVWIKDAGRVLKIIMPSSGDITQAAFTFKKFYEFCVKHQYLSCLPKFIPIQGQAYAEFTLGDKRYMQISMEQLNKIPRNTMDEGVVWFFSEYVSDGLSWLEVKKRLESHEIWRVYNGNLRYAVNLANEWTRMTVHGENPKKYAEYELLYEVMKLLYKTGKINKMYWDLHTENAMLRDDGTIVIIDPWFERYSGSMG